MVELEAYAVDCRVYGSIDLGDRRLTDMLNATPQLLIRDARLESLDDGHVVEMPELEIDRDELCAVVASGPRGDVGRRIRTHATRVEVDLGPYHVEGAVHGTPASDPLGAAVRRAPWVPLTEVTVRYHRGEHPVSEDVATLLINRDFARSFKAFDEPSVVLPWETPRAARPPTPRARDLTDSPRDEAGADHEETAPPKASEPSA